MKRNEEVSKKVNRQYVIERNIWACLAIFSAISIFLFQDSAWGLRLSSALTVFALVILANYIFNIGFKRKHFIFVGVLLCTGFIASPLYFIYPNYDKILHLLGVLPLCSILFFMIRKLHLEMKWKIIFVFFTAFALLGFFELGEYTIDKLFDFKLQGVYLRDIYGLDKFTSITSPIDDTMIDLFFGAFGASIYCTWISYIYKKKTRRHLLDYS